MCCCLGSLPWHTPTTPTRSPATTQLNQPPSRCPVRQHRPLMEQMAGREHWEADPLWLKAGRAIGIVAISIAVIAGIAFAALVFATS